jgi:hypothetical protein
MLTCCLQRAPGVAVEVVAVQRPRSLICRKPRAIPIPDMHTTIHIHNTRFWIYCCSVVHPAAWLLPELWQL